MTRRHFIALADALRGAEVSEDILTRLCRFMRQQNSRFDSSRWRRYLAGECGPYGGVTRQQRREEAAREAVREGLLARAGWTPGNAIREALLSRAEEIAARTRAEQIAEQREPSGVPWA